MFRTKTLSNSKSSDDGWIRKKDKQTIKLVVVNETYGDEDFVSCSLMDISPATTTKSFVVRVMVTTFTKGPPSTLSSAYLDYY